MVVTEPKLFPLWLFTEGAHAIFQEAIKRTGGTIFVVCL